MKPILTIYCAFMLTNAVNAQQPDQALVKVQYNFIHISDTTQRDKPYTESMLLIAGKNASFYTSYDQIEQEVNTQLQLAEMRKKGIHQMDNVQMKATSFTQYYFFDKEHKFVSAERMSFNYLVEDDIDKIDWKIAKDTMGFSGIHCQKATAHYKGRNWIAWFAAELPFECGPWKLHGLPGLIIEAYDDKKEVQFKFAGLQKIKDGDLAVESAAGLSEPVKRFFIHGLDISQVALPPEGQGMNGGYIIVTKKDYDKLKTAYDQDPAAFRDAQLAGSGMPTSPRSNSIGAGNGGMGGGSGMRGGGGGGGGGSGGSGMRGGSGGGGSNGGNGYGISYTFTPRIPVNNPIELPEKK